MTFGEDFLFNLICHDSLWLVFDNLQPKNCGVADLCFVNASIAVNSAPGVIVTQSRERIEIREIDNPDNYVIMERVADL